MFMFTDKFQYYSIILFSENFNSFCIMFLLVRSSDLYGSFFAKFCHYWRSWLFSLSLRFILSVRQGLKYWNHIPFQAWKFRENKFWRQILERFKVKSQYECDLSLKRSHGSNDNLTKLWYINYFFKSSKSLLYLKYFSHLTK